MKAALGRARPVCTLYALSRSEHLQQIYAGFYGLHEAGLIRLEQRFELPSGIATSFGAARLHGLFVRVENAGLVFLDVRDGPRYFAELLPQLALYAKRSFCRARHATANGKIVPLGLNYSVSLDRMTMPELTKALRQAELSRAGLQRLAFALARLFPFFAGETPTVSTISAPPDPSAPPRVVFLARTYPAELVIDDAEVEHGHLNELRAECIRALRARFGDAFCGGFARTPFAVARYPDCVVDAGFSTHRLDYLKRLRAYPVCVATTGLAESIGWKFAEYVALSKAIVCEPLHFEVPGPMEAGANYLEFGTPAECASRVAELFEDSDLRGRMMARNADYYAEYGTPDAVVARVLHRLVI